ncbi:MAG: bifunctional DNA-formamidopyrimidine glycosylase/DNA-(apurinic or apyrimidinic site) lyase [Thermodesulfobacteriota bacterium]|nr:bifunctional DNA-formamidopyrimidine glycosylase/DNA-(apurinic or apyrimidinic site) lyase [Thermodesulfobacteriota bacterium]
MPELPEIEVICQGLLPHLINREIIDVRCSGKQLRSPVRCEELQRELQNNKIVSLTRRAKYLVLKTDKGTMLVIHLGMTGNMGIFDAGSLIKKHDHVCWLLDNKTELRFNDTRRFGAVRLFSANNAAKEEKKFFSATGPEPFSRACSVAYLMQRAARRKQPVKNFIMDSHVIAGIGNIYANETLFHSRIHPERPAVSLSAKEWKRLLTVMRKTLKHAIKCGGSTISDFVNASGEGGYFQMNFRIYGKAGKTCSRCGQVISKKIIGGRSSFFCQKCQPKPADSSR